LEKFDGGKHTADLDGESFTGYALYTSFERSARTWTFDIDYWNFSPTFRADNGFIVRNDQHQGNIWTGLGFRPNGRVLINWFPSVSVGRVWNHRGTIKDGWIRTELSARFRGQTVIWTQLLLSGEELRGVFFDDIRIFNFEVENSALKSVYIGSHLSYGNTIARNENPPVMGRTFEIDVWGGFKPLQQFTIEPELSYFKLNNRDTKAKIAEGSVFRTRFNYQLTRELFVRMIVQYDDFDQALSLEPLVTYKINPFTVFYVGSNYAMNYDIKGRIDSSLHSRQFFLKFQYLFSV
jgi:hypothetical protein